eukprot:scaffold251168_cov30-Tisochrysis_lutea.AAC.1
MGRRPARAPSPTGLDAGRSHSPRLKRGSPPCSFPKLPPTTHRRRNMGGWAAQIIKACFLA